MWFSWRLKPLEYGQHRPHLPGRGRPPASDQAAGFSLDRKEVKRAGLDYWKQVNLTVWNSFDEMIDAQRPNEDEMAVFTKTGARLFWTMPRPQRLFLVFGSETRGLPNLF